MMPDNEAEIIEAAWAAYTSHVMDFFTYDPELTRRLRESVESAVLAASPIERLQARFAQLERDSAVGPAKDSTFGNTITGASEFICDSCGGPNPIAWHAPSPLWNRVMRVDGTDRVGFCCPSCFIIVAQERGIDGAWHLSFDEADLDAMWTDMAGRRWNRETCLWDEPAED